MLSFSCYFCSKSRTTKPRIIQHMIEAHNRKLDALLLDWRAKHVTPDWTLVKDK